MNDERNGPGPGNSRDSGPSGPSSLGKVARDLLEQARRDPAGLSAHAARLSVRQQAELALMLPADRRLELLLHAPKPMRLVRALPHADFYLTVREIGPVDALPLVSLASTGQLCHLLDLESWRKDRFDADRCGAWVALIVEAGESPTRRFLRHADDELLALLFRDWIRVEQIEYEDSAEVHGHGEGEAGSRRGALTPDGYHRFAPRIPEHLPAIRRLLQLFYQEQTARYEQIVWRARWELPAELEEAAFHWRQSRLEEHGFPGLDEALSVYAAPSGTKSQAIPARPEDPDRPAASHSLVPLLTAHGPLAGAIDLLPDAVREQALHGLLSVANRLLVADVEDAGDPEAHRRAMNKAAGYVRIALAERGAVEPAAAARVLEKLSPLELFREGHERAAELARRARSLLETGWPAGRREALELLDWPVESQIRALLAERPLYYEVDVERGAGRPREFAAPEEIIEIRGALETAELLGRLFVERMGLDLARLREAAGGEPAAAPPRFSAVLLTAMAWHATRGVLRGEPLSPEVAADFVRGVASRRTADVEAPPRALEAWIEALDAEVGLEPREGSILRAYGRFALERLSEECGALDPGLPLDPRYVSCLFLAGGAKGPAE